LFNVDKRGLSAGAVTMLLAALGVAAPGGAQNTAGDDRPATKSANVGSVQGRGFRIGASLKTLYDGNILRLGDGLPLRPGASKSDFRISPSVSAAYGLPVGRQQLFIGADFGKDFYARNNRLDRTRYSIGGGALWRVGRSCSGSISGEYKQRQSLLSESSVQTDNTQRVQDYFVGGECAPPVGLGFGGSISRSVTDNVNPARQVQDSRDWTYDLHLNYGSPGLGNFSLGGGYSHYDYPRRTLFVQSGGGLQSISDKLDNYQARVSYSRAIGTRLSVSGSASYVKVVPNPREVLNLIQLPSGLIEALPNARASYSGPGFSLSAQYRPNARVGTSLSASRNVSSSRNVGARFNIRDNVAGEVTYRFGPAIDTAVGASWDRRQYKGGFATFEEPLVRVEDKITRAYGRASYSPRELYAVDFEVAHQWRSSNPSIYNYDSTTAFVTLRVKFGRG